MLRFTLVAAALALTSAFTAAPASAPASATRAAASPAMSAGDRQDAMTRRVALATLLTAVPAAANAMTVPGLNAPGLVPAKKVPKQPKPDFDTIRDAGSNHFWSAKGIMNSVPKVKGIITPKSAINGGL